MSTTPTAPPAADTTSGSNLALALAEAQAADVVLPPLEATTTMAAPGNIAETHPEATRTTGTPGEIANAPDLTSAARTGTAPSPESVATTMAALDPGQPETTPGNPTAAAALLLALAGADGPPPATSGDQGNVTAAVRLAQVGATSTGANSRW